MLNFKLVFSLSSFTLTQRLFSSSSLSAIRVVSSAYLRLLIFFQAILIPVCASSSLAFHMMYSGASLVAQRLKRLPATWETWVRSLGREDPLEKEMPTHSSILAWRIPWREEPGGLQPMGSRRVAHNWSDSVHTRTSAHRPNGRERRGSKEPPDEGKRRESKSWLKTQHSKNWDHGIWSHHFMANRWGKSGNSGIFYFLGFPNHCGWWLQPWN